MLLLSACEVIISFSTPTDKGEVNLFLYFSYVKHLSFILERRKTKNKKMKMNALGAACGPTLPREVDSFLVKPPVAPNGHTDYSLVSPTTQDSAKLSLNS